MLYWSAVFLIIALVAGALGFGLVGGVALKAAEILFYVFIILFVLSLVTGAVRRPTP